MKNVLCQYINGSFFRIEQRILDEISQSKSWQWLVQTLYDAACSRIFPFQNAAQLELRAAAEGISLEEAAACLAKLPHPALKLAEMLEVFWTGSSLEVHRCRMLFFRSLLHESKHFQFLLDSQQNIDDLKFQTDAAMLQTGCLQTAELADACKRNLDFSN